MSEKEKVKASSHPNLTSVLSRLSIPCCLLKESHPIFLQICELCPRHKPDGGVSNFLFKPFSFPLLVFIWLASFVCITFFTIYHAKQDENDVMLHPSWIQGESGGKQKWEMGRKQKNITLHVAG